MLLPYQLPELGHVRNVLLIVVITALMAIATAAIAYLFDMIPARFVAANYPWHFLGSQALRAGN